jgi:hypothetical protein
MPLFVTLTVLELMLVRTLFASFTWRFLTSVRALQVPATAHLEREFRKIHEDGQTLS